MKKSTSKLMAIAMLSSLVLLGACGKQESAKDSFSNSKSKTVQTSKSSSSSKVKAKKTTKSSSSQVSSSSSQATSSETSIPSSAVQTEQSQATTTAQASQNQAAASQSTVEQPDTTSNSDLANGNFASIAGTWTNDLGATVTIGADGSVSYSNQGNLTAIQGSVSNGGFAGSLYDPNSPVGSVPIWVSADQGTITIGQSTSETAHPFHR